MYDDKMPSLVGSVRGRKKCHN